MSQELNEARINELMEKVGMVFTGGAMTAGIQLGESLGFYRALAAGGGQTADQVAESTGCNLRLTREWLDGQVAIGFVSYDTTADTYALDTEATLLLADENSPMFISRGMVALASIFFDMEKIEKAFRGDGGLAWGQHHPCLFKGTEWFFRPGYRAHLPSEWLPAMDGAVERLKAGGRVADVGCGHGASVVAMAEAYPGAQFFGFDYHAPSIETARQRAEEAGVSERCTFAVADAKSYEGEFDLICYFDCLHDMGDPVGIAKHARSRLSSAGSVLLVEPFALADRVTNIKENPLAAMMYTISSMVCTPNSLSQEVKLGLGAQAGEARLGKVFADAGFGNFRQVSQTPFNLIFEARP